MSNFDYDVVYIGSGHAAFHGAGKLVKKGRKVAVVEADKLGGTCPNYGCDAKLLLDGPFEVVQDAQNYQGFGLDGQPQINWDDLMDYKKKFINVGLPQMMEQLLPQTGIDIYRGQGSLVDEHTVSAGDKTITAEYIVLATGQHDSTLPVEGKEYINNSKDFLDLAKLPQSLVIIGAGLISLEFASMVIKAGVKVDVVEFTGHALANYYRDYVDKLVAKLEKDGVKFHFNEAVTKIQPEDKEYTVQTKSGLTLQGEYVLGGTGREVNINGLNLDNLGIKGSPKGIEVNDHLQTTVPNIYVSGDAIAKTIPKLTPTATFESNYIAAQILGEDDQPIKYPVVPIIAFTLPRLAEVGLPITKAKEEPDKYQITKTPYGQGFDTKHDSDAELTLAFNKQTKQVVGAALYGEDASYLINILTFVIDKGLTSDDLDQLIFGFPDVSYSILGSVDPNGLLG